MIFFDGNQSDEVAKQRREQDSRPCIMLNRIKRRQAPSGHHVR
jgi:hypothetical protein